MEEYLYQIGKIRYRQNELTWAQDKKLSEIFYRALASDPEADLTIGDIIKFITERNLLGSFLYFLLKPETKMRFIFKRAVFSILWLLRIKRGAYFIIEPDNIANSTLTRIFNDFFLLNAELLNRLKGFESIMGLIARAATEPEKEK